MNSVNSRLQVLGGENTYIGGKFDAFFNVFCILGVFLGAILKQKFIKFYTLFYGTELVP